MSEVRERGEGEKTVRDGRKELHFVTIPSFKRGTSTIKLTIKKIISGHLILDQPLGKIENNPSPSLLYRDEPALIDISNPTRHN